MRALAAVPDRRPRVVIADDHAAARTGIRASLEDGGFAVVGEAGTAAAAVVAAVEHEPDVVLLDVHMPGSGIAAARDITGRVPAAVVVMLTVSRDDADLFAALRAGAAGYLLKDMDPDRLSHALRGALAGEAALPRELMARVLDELRGRRDRRLRLRDRGVQLTDREWEVLDLLREGRATREIAARLAISEVTVRRHRSEVLRKLGVPDAGAAARLLEAA